MVTPSYQIRCAQKKLIAPNVYELRFEKPAGLSFRPGQFLLFDIPLVSDPLNIQTRACSIASSPDEDDLLFVIKIKIGGRLGDWVAKTVEVGSMLGIKGPFGLFTLRPNTHDLLFAATGAGIAPFRSHIVHALQKGDKRAMHLFFGVRTEADLFWTEELKSLETQYQNFHLHLCLSGDNPDWNGNRGRIQQFIPESIKNSSITDLYICGAPEMVSDIKKIALESWGMQKANVHAEGYI